MFVGVAKAVGEVNQTGIIRDMGLLSIIILMVKLCIDLSEEGNR